jgi:hypothetical protein
MPNSASVALVRQLYDARDNPEVIRRLLSPGYLHRFDGLYRFRLLTDPRKTGRNR